MNATRFDYEAHNRKSEHRLIKHDGDCKLWLGELKKYQSEAAFEYDTVGLTTNPWDWIYPTCGNERCISVEHTRVRGNIVLHYPDWVCIYCGQRANSRDHLLPRTWTGDAKRHFVVTVPACRTCNTLLRDTLTWSITERRAVAHARLRKKYRKVLAQIDFTEEELDEFGPGLRPAIEQGIQNKKAVNSMLAFPTDPEYDARALQKSGLDDPWALGLILPDDDDLEAFVRAVA